MSAKKRPIQRRGAMCATVALAVSLTAHKTMAVTTTLTTIATNGYFTSDTNSCTIDINNLTTVGGFQFAAYYDSGQNLMLARRHLRRIHMADVQHRFRHHRRL